ncbi:YidB family protein [Enterovirga sp.]|uniref:YidB family protein n=1 Tax=Enterovirga sp. TaxID=2026350 RepID=UPI002BA3FAD8|nr:YidB family protein [Enterovirga sp.]HMO27876.1 YidB family protein [Enterovirga sp.]
MGLLDDVIGSVTGGGKDSGKESSSGTSPLTKALLMLLAAKMATSYFGRSSAPAGDSHAGSAPPPAPSGKIESGILAGLPSLGSLFGGSSSQEAPSPAPAPGGKIESGILAGLPSLDSILGSLRSGGHGDKVDSWIGDGDNKEVPPQDLGKAIGPEMLEQLSKATGIPKDTLLQQLSGVLPEVVDKLTPGGTLPDPKDRSHW